MKRFLALSIFSIGAAVACCDSPFFPPDPPPEVSCGWFSCEEIPTINPPAPPPVPPCGYGGTCQLKTIYMPPVVKVIF